VSKVTEMKRLRNNRLFVSSTRYYYIEYGDDPEDYTGYVNIVFGKLNKMGIRRELKTHYDFEARIIFQRNIYQKRNNMTPWIEKSVFHVLQYIPDEMLKEGVIKPSKEKTTRQPKKKGISRFTLLEF
jgi:hypothetical protein